MIEGLVFLALVVLFFLIGYWLGRRKKPTQPTDGEAYMQHKKEGK